MITNEWISGNKNIDGILKLREMSGAGSSSGDCFDEFAMHLAVYVDAMPASTGRLYVGDDNCFHIGCIGVLPCFRHSGLGDLTVKLLMYRGFHYASVIKITVGRDRVSFFKPYGFEIVAESSDSVEMAVEKECCIYPSKCGNGGHL